MAGKIQVTSYRLQVTGYKLQVTSYTSELGSDWLRVMHGLYARQVGLSRFGLAQLCTARTDALPPVTYRLHARYLLAACMASGSHSSARREPMPSRLARNLQLVQVTSYKLQAVPAWHVPRRNGTLGGHVRGAEGLAVVFAS